VGGHLDGGGHPGELAGLGDDGVVGAEGELEDRHGSAEDAVLHDGLLINVTGKVYGDRGSSRMNTDKKQGLTVIKKIKEG
jgi:hypothetical protein